MEIGMIGLGRMGASMAQRLVRGGHRVVGFDSNEMTRAGWTSQGVGCVDSLEALVGQLQAARAIWLMVPAGEAVDRTIAALLPLLTAGDVIVDGGNSNYKDTLRRAATLGEQQIHLVDCGTSGGIWGLTEGYSLMIGGELAVVERLQSIFQTLAPARDRGWGRVGPSGAGHFTKMIHNGIEYGLMQAYAEGFSIMQHKPEFGLDLHQVAEIWRHGSVVRSWLLDLTSNALDNNPDMSGVAPHVADSGEGRWTVREALDLNVPAPVITQSVIQRLRSRDSESFSDRLLASMRNEFGGHPTKQA